MPRLQVASVVDQAYLAIRDRISDGTLPRGGRLHQEDLAAELGVSRTPVREALRRLAAEGLVEMHTNRGARVADIDAADMPTPYEARLVVEPGAARLAAERGLTGPQQRMRDAIARQRAAIPDVARSFAANRDFHIALVEAAGNELVLRFVQNLWVSRIGAAIYELQAETPEQMRQDADEHEEILEAIVGGDARRAESLTRRHVAGALRRLSRLPKSEGQASMRTRLRSVPTPPTKTSTTSPSRR
jgi:DNA-binding GntR family transcriptional regulator